MLIKTAAARHGRRALATPLPAPGSVLRLLSTEANPTSSAPTTQSLPTSQPATALPKLASSAKKKQRIVEEVIMTLGADSAQEHSGPAWAKSSLVNKSGEKLTVAQQYAEFQDIQKSTRTLGSKLERRYMPTENLRSPPKPEDVTLELLMASQTHMGHNTSLWNPANSRYIYGVRQGIHIIALETTAAHLRRAARVVEEVSYRGGLILFVGTRKGQMEIVTRAAELAGATHLFTKWTPGAITNRDVILRGQATKVVDQGDKELDGFDMYKGTARPLMPDLVVCLNPLENYTLLYECGLKNIPTIGVIDTNVDPSWVTYTIPANDDSFRSVALIAGVLGRAGQAGQKRRVADAAKGKISWMTDPQLERHMKKEVHAAILKRKEVMGRMQAEVQGFTDDEMKLLRSQILSSQEQEVTEESMLDLMSEAALGEEGSEAARKAAEKMVEDVVKAEETAAPEATTTTATTAAAAKTTPPPPPPPTTTTTTTTTPTTTTTTTTTTTQSTSPSTTEAAQPQSGLEAKADVLGAQLNALKAETADIEAELLGAGKSVKSSP